MNVKSFECIYLISSLTPEGWTYEVSEPVSLLRCQRARVLLPVIEVRLRDNFGVKKSRQADSAVSRHGGKLEMLGDVGEDEGLGHLEEGDHVRDKSKRQRSFCATGRNITILATCAAPGAAARARLRRHRC